MAEAQRALAALNDEAVGTLRLGASTTVAQYVLPRILGAFLREYPQVKLSLVSGNTEKDCGGGRGGARGVGDY